MAGCLNDLNWKKIYSIYEKENKIENTYEAIVRPITAYDLETRADA